MSYASKRIAYISVLTAIAVVLNIFTIPTGVRYFVLSFTYIPCFIAGYKLGLIDAFLVGFLGDLIGAIIRPFGPYLPLIGIASGLLGLIPALVFKFTHFNKNLQTVLSYLLVLIICTAGINTYAIYRAFSQGQTFFAFLALRLPFQAIVVFINMSITLFLLKPIDKHLVYKS